MITRILYHNYRLSSGVKHWFWRRFTPAGKLVMACALLAAGLGMDTNQAMAYQVFALLAAMIVVSLLWTFAPVPKIQPSRALPRVGTAGQPLHYRISLFNPGTKRRASLSLKEDLVDPRPNYQQFRDTPEPGEKKRNPWDRTFRFYRWMWLINRNQMAEAQEIALPPIPPGRTIEIAAQITPRKRGLLQLTGIHLAAPDPFGVTRGYARVPLEQRVLILPKRYPIPPIVLPGQLEYQPGGVTYASAIGESGEFTALREYRRGDPLRHIHWKSVGKTGKLIVKEFQDEFFMRHALILDTFLQDAAEEELFEEAVAVASSFAHALNTQESLLDLLFVGPKAYAITAGRSVGQVEQLLEILATVQPCTTTTFEVLADLVKQRLELVSGAVCVFLEWDARREELLRYLKLAHIPVFVFVLWNGKGEPVGEPEFLEEEDRFLLLTPGKVRDALAQL